MSVYSLLLFIFTTLAVGLTCSAMHLMCAIAAAIPHVTSALRRALITYAARTIVEARKINEEDDQ